MINLTNLIRQQSKEDIKANHFTLKLRIENHAVWYEKMIWKCIFEFKHTGARCFEWFKNSEFIWNGSFTQIDLKFKKRHENNLLCWESNIMQIKMNELIKLLKSLKKDYQKSTWLLKELFKMLLKSIQHLYENEIFMNQNQMNY